MWILFLNIAAGILGLWISDRFVPGVEFTGKLFIVPRSSEDISAFLSTLAFAGAFLGVLNFFVKPILKKITFPLRIITLNLFSLVIVVAMVWITDVVFPELQIEGLKPLFWTTAIVWALGFVFVKWLPSGRTREEKK